MSERRKSRSYSKETEDKIDRDLSDSVNRGRQTRRRSVSRKKQSDVKPKKEKSDSKKKEYDYVTLELSRKACSTILKAAGLPGDTNGLKISAKVSFKANK